MAEKKYKVPIYEGSKHVGDKKVNASNASEAQNEIKARIAMSGNKNLKTGYAHEIR